MFSDSAITLITNGLTLALASGFLIILLWHDSRKRLTQFFAVFLFLVMLWNSGSLLLQAALFISINDILVLNSAIALMELGYTGSSVALYVLVTLLSGTHSSRFRLIAFTSLAVVIVYRILLSAGGAISLSTDLNEISTYRLQTLPVLFYFSFNLLTLYLTWMYRRSLRSNILTIGILVFILGQSLALFNPEIPVVSVATNISSVGALLISLFIIRQEIIMPLSDRDTQVRTMHKVSLAITSQLSIDTVLNEIAVQAAGWLEADGVGIFLRMDGELELVNVYNLPSQMIHHRIPLGKGIAGTVAMTQQSIVVENYGRDWRKEPDLPLACETFGSVVCAPLVYGSTVTGVLMVITGKQGRLFNQDDMQLLELLGSQAAVAISHSRLFEQQRKLTAQVENARSQLETLLSSTDNPVLAADEQLNLIFTNPAAERLFHLDTVVPTLENAVLRDVFPESMRRAVNGKLTNTFELSLDDQVYLCHLATLGRSDAGGWVVVMHDITQLKELDRIKSEMVRMASHDLKNPLMGAMLYLDLVRDAVDAAPVNDLIDVIERQLDRMNRIIRGVLDLEQIRNGVISPNLCFAHEIVESAVGEIQVLAREKNIKMTTHADQRDLQVMCDIDQFERALVNLIENAIKFTPEGGAVDVTIKREADNVVFEISDTGIGIPKDLHQQVFERFFRGRQKGVEHVTGSGLGLSIVKTIIDNHQGKIWLKSIANEGTSFFIALPLADARELV